jgi:hypothetical protein
LAATANVATLTKFIRGQEIESGQGSMGPRAHEGEKESFPLPWVKQRRLVGDVSRGKLHIVWAAWGTGTCIWMCVAWTI